MQMKQSRINRAYLSIYSDDYYKLPRKIKKVILGCKISRRELRHKLKTFKIYKLPKNIHESIEANQDLFCPRCGCEWARTTRNMAEYPDLFERLYCLRCGFLVMEADNSPYHHCLEFPENNYNIDF
jgi:ribosomal protein S27AE